MNPKPVPSADYLAHALWTFRCDAQGYSYSIALIPHSENDCSRMESEAARRHMSLAEYAKDAILVTLMLGEISEAQTE